MKFKEFKDWCNQRACDGCWSRETAIYCIALYNTVQAFPFWKREKMWRERYEKDTVEKVVNVIEAKMKEFGIR